MTNEQIREAAAKYIVEDFEPTGVITEDRLKCFIAGAHSRDEEIEHYRRIATAYKIDAQDTAAECERLYDIIDQLRNPWISVEDRLPKENVGVLVRREDDFYLYGKVINGGKWYCYGFGWQEKYKITHWMPIPELKKGE